jgi:uncharacterized protein
MDGEHSGKVERILPEPDDFDPEEFAAKGAAGLLAEGVELFNAGRYHAAHEAFEQVWLASEAGDAAFFKGLVQAAICLFKLERGELEGARLLHTGARGLLGPYLPTHRGLDVQGLLAEMAAHLRPLLRARPGEPVELDPATLPRMRLDTA